jgi:hypothetical protein
VLIVASAATLEIWAAGLDSLRRGLQNQVCACPRKSRPFFDHRRFYGFARQDKRHEHGLASAMLVGGQTRQAVAAID